MQICDLLWEVTPISFASQTVKTSRNGADTRHSRANISAFLLIRLTNTISLLQTYIYPHYTFVLVQFNTKTASQSTIYFGWPHPKIDFFRHFLEWGNKFHTNFTPKHLSSVVILHIQITGNHTKISVDSYFNQEEILELTF